MHESECQHVVAILIDNVHGEKFLDYLNSGLLPNLKEHVLDRGSYCKHSICQFPSSSSNGHTTLTTGTFQSKHCVLNATYWDTTAFPPVPYKVDEIAISTLKLWDKIIQAKTMFEYVPNKDSASFHAIKRGAGLRFFTLRRLARYAPLFLRMRKEGADEVAEEEGLFEGIMLKILRNNMKRIKKKGEFPKMSFILNLPTDDKAHKFGHDSEQYKQALVLVDTIVGLMVDGFDEKGKHHPGIRELGYYERTAFALFADHSSKPFSQDRRVDLVSELKRDFDWTLYIAPKMNKKEKFGAWDALTYLGAEHVPLYLPTSGHQTLREFSVEDMESYTIAGSPTNFKEYFFQCEAVARIYHPVDKDTIVVHSRGGIAKMTRQAGEGNARSYKYEVVTGKDPLQYAEEAPSLADGEFHTHLEWLRGTYQKTFPNVPDHMFGYFGCYLAPTLIVTSKDGWIFYHPDNPNDHSHKHVNDHDGEYRYEVSTPLVIGGPGVKKGVEVPVCQNVDMLPTILRLLKLPFSEADFHGRPLEEILED